MADLQPFDPNAFNVNFKATPSPVNQQADIFSGLNQGYAGAIAGQTTVPNLITQYDERFGVPQMQQRIQQGTEQYDALGNQIRALPQDVAQRSQESILTQGQKNRMVQAEQTPLLEQQGLLGQNLSRMGQNLATAQSNAARMVSAEQVQQEKELAPWLKAYDNENILSSMRMTGWSFENQSELTRLLSNQQAGITMSEGERNRMNQLAVAEKNFQNQLKLQQDAAKNTGTDYLTIGEGTTVFNPVTGQPVYTAPKTYKSESSGTSFNYAEALQAMRGSANTSTPYGPVYQPSPNFKPIQ